VLSQAYRSHYDDRRKPSKIYRNSRRHVEEQLAKNCFCTDVLRNSLNTGQFMWSSAHSSAQTSCATRYIRDSLCEVPHTLLRRRLAQLAKYVSWLKIFVTRFVKKKKGGEPIVFNKYSLKAFKVSGVSIKTFYSRDAISQHDSRFILKIFSQTRGKKIQFFLSSTYNILGTVHSKRPQYYL
jgi:hypothetical protein